MITDEKILKFIAPFGEKMLAGPVYNVHVWVEDDELKYQLGASGFSRQVVLYQGMPANEMFITIKDAFQK